MYLLRGPFINTTGQEDIYNAQHKKERKKKPPSNSLSKRGPEMACRTAFRFVFLAEPWLPVYLNQTSVCASLRTRRSSFSLRLSGKFRARDFHTARRTQLDCSHNETPSSSSEDDQDPPQEAVLKAISGSPPFYLSKPALFLFIYLESCYGSK